VSKIKDAVQSNDTPMRRAKLTDTAVARKADDPFAKIAHFDQTKVYLIVDEAVLKKITSKQMKKYLFSDGCFTREFLGRSQMAVAMNQQKDDDESQSLT
jgi:hypothetical protein